MVLQENSSINKSEQRVKPTEPHKYNKNSFLYVNKNLIPLDMNRYKIKKNAFWGSVLSFNSIYNQYYKPVYKIKTSSLNYSTF